MKAPRNAVFYVCRDLLLHMNTSRCLVYIRLREDIRGIVVALWVIRVVIRNDSVTSATAEWYHPRRRAGILATPTTNVLQTLRTGKVL